MRILGHKPSEIRKAIAGFCAAFLVLLVALPVAGLPMGVAAVVASVSAFLTAVGVYLSKRNVAAIIDSLDTAEFELPFFLGEDDDLVM